jgi:tRNA pseudouridine55 synthase
MKEEKMDGILVIDKPQGLTSFGVVARIKKCINKQKVGHCGTLDPLATGVLPLLLGKATKALPFLPDTRKEYIANFQFGITTDTQDITGRILNFIKNSDKVFANKKEVLEILNEFIGDSLQIPPMYSALKHNGKRLYELARKGITVEREARSINISKIKLLEFSEIDGNGKLLINCSKGTYIRTICHDLGEKLGCGAVLTALRRIKSSGFTIDQSIPLKQIEEKPEEILNNLIICDAIQRFL